LLFDEDEWRNGVNTAGFVDRLQKELAIMKVYRLTRNRYGIEHHTMFLQNEYMRAYGGGGFRHPSYTDEQYAAATDRARAAFVNAILHLNDHRKHPDAFSPLERPMLDWIEAVVTSPHSAYTFEPALRRELDTTNRHQVEAGTRRLDRSSGLTDAQAYQRLVDRQVAELAMLVGHMDGLGRTFSILRTEGEPSVQVAKGQIDDQGRIAPELDANGRLQLTGYFNNRAGIIPTLRALGVPETVLTANELLLNPKLNERVVARLGGGDKQISVNAGEALETGEF
jgi:hypothetical protein